MCHGAISQTLRECGVQTSWKSAVIIANDIVFLCATKDLYKRVCSSVGRSVHYAFSFSAVSACFGAPHGQYWLLFSSCTRLLQLALSPSLPASFFISFPFTFISLHGRTCRLYTRRECPPSLLQVDDHLHAIFVAPQFPSRCHTFYKANETQY